MECFSLSSSPTSTDDSYIIVCQHTTVTLTCTATQIETMTWLANGLQITVFTVSDYDSEGTGLFHNDPYNIMLTLTIDNIMTVGQGNRIGDFTSTLEVNTDDIDNGTVITCAIFQNYHQLIIYIASKFF